MSAGTLFFTADDGVHGRELWKSDGTEAGTVLVKDIDPDRRRRRATHGPSYLTAVGGTLFFTADDGIHGEELWKSDGTRAGTVLVKDIDPRDGVLRRQQPVLPDRVGGTLFFTADDGIHGHGAVEVRRHRGGHGPGQGHHPAATATTTTTARPT